MYERNAIILERYFDKMFGYNQRNNIKTNFKDYIELVSCLEKYKNISDEEETIMQEYDSIANKIRDIQKEQENLNKKNTKLQTERSNLFQSISEDTDDIQKKLDSLNNNIQIVNDEIEENAKKFVEVVDEFDKKSIIRTNCGRTRRTIENEYNKKLNETLDNYQNIDMEIEKTAKKFVDIETTNIENELKESMKKNGEKEKIPFDLNVVAKAITVTIDIQKRETEIYASIYDKTNRLFTEIKNNSTKIEKHKKAIKDANCRLEFLNAIKEYLIQFLDNERLTVVNGKEEHATLMQEACKNLDEDLVQINNLYTLLLKEISKKITRKTYNELYKIEYLGDLEEKAEDFDNEIKKLNLPVTIINPNYWRIEGMKKIYDVFYRCVTENYDRDLSEFIPELQEDKENTDIEEIEEQQQDNYDEETENKVQKNKKEDAKAEIDKKIDMILGLDKKNDNEEENWQDEEEIDVDWDEDQEEDWEDDWDEEKDEENQEDDNDDDWDEEEDNEIDDDEQDKDIDFDIWGNIDQDNKNNIVEKSDDDWGDEEEDKDWDDEDNEDEEDDNDDWDEDDEEDDEIDDEDETDEDENDDDDDEHEEIKDEDEEEIEEKPSKKAKRKNKNDKTKKETNDEDNWENEFINIKKKEPKKKRGFFDKFKK